MKDNNNLRMTLKAALDNLWSRISGIFGTVNSRIDDAEDRIDDIETDVSGVTSRVAGVENRMTTAEGQITGLDNRVDDIEDAMDDLEGGMIKSISLNGVNVPKDAQGNVALQETDPTVPAWAKQVKAKTSDFTNDGADGVHPYISQGDVTVPTKTSDLLNDGDDGTTYYVTWRQLSDSKDQAFIDENYIELTQDNIRREFTKDEHYQGEAFFMYASPAGLTAMLPNGSQYTRYSNCTFRGLVYTSKQYMTLDDYNMVGWMEGPGIHELVTGYIDTDWSGEDPTIYITEITQIGGGGGSGGDVNIIEAISFNGTNVPPDAGKRVSLTETDPTVPAWAKATTKPAYTAQEVGALPANTPIPSKTSDLTNDSGFLTSSTGVSGVKGNAETGGYRHGNVILTPANIGAKAVQSAVSDPTASGTAVAFIDSISQNAQGVISPTKKTVQSASQSAAGLMSAADKKKLDGIEAGAQVNSVTGVKGNAESSYRTGNVNLTPVNIGAVAKSGDTMTGQLSLTPAGSEGGQILLGASSDHPEHAGINIDQHGPSKLRIFGQPSADGTSITGVGTPLEINPYAKTITGGYTFTGNVTGTASGNVAKSGDTMTGSLTVQSSSIALTDTAKGNLTVYMHISGSGDFGIYSNGYYNGSSFVSGGKWLVSRDTNGVIRLGNAVPVDNGGTGATTAAGARTNLGIATTVMTVTTTGITSHGNWVSGLKPNEVVIDAAYCAAGTVAVTPYVNSDGKWAFHCIRVSTGEAYGTAFDLTIRYHNIY